VIGQLQILSGPDAGKVILLFPGQAVVLGQGPVVVQGLHDPQLGRVHCQLDVTKDQILLMDSGSHVDGTQVNGERLAQPHSLKPGDVIRIGQTQLHFMTEAQGAETVTAVPGSLAAPKPMPSRTSKPVKPSKPKLLEGQPLSALVGQQLSNFQIESVLAPGDSGIVFKAHDLQFDRPVAVKVLNPDFTKTKEQVQRFVRSMKTVLPLAHPNLVAVYGAGRIGDFCWTAMELVEGDNLAEVVKQIGASGVLDWRIALRMAIHLTKALAYAHERHIIHRNITPSNVLVRRSDRVAKLGDLMHAKALEGTLAVQLTRPGSLVGKLAYTPPEILENPANADPRSDMYSLGALIYVVLTGKPPFESRSFTELVRLIATAPVLSPRRSQPKLPKPFEEAVVRLLAKQPSERYSSAAELLEMLEGTARFHGMEL
jgi:hypothetical protein